MRERVAELDAAKAKARAMGGEERLSRQRAKGKLDARARIGLLFDAGTFEEFGLLATAEGALPEEESVPSPADGVVTGIGEVEGRPVALAAYDFTVYGGSIGEVGEKKVARLRDLALKHRIPIVWLIDSGGARLGAAGVDGKRIAGFADTGYLFREQAILSGVVPQVAAMVGPGAAGTAYIPGLADYVPMVKGTSSLALAGPYLVESVVGEKVSEEELGGSRVHNEVSGNADGEFPDDAACLAAVRTYLSYMPSRSGEAPPIRPCTEPLDRRDESLLDLVPDSPRRAYDMRKLLATLVDTGSLFEMKPRWARNMVTAFARIGGRTVGLVANNPMYFAGAIDVDAADKAARFIDLCDAFEVPLAFFQDVPGFMVGTKMERAGVVRHGAKMLQAVACATVPKFTVVVRKGYGAGYYVMNGRAFEPDLIVAWPGAEISVMGPEGMVAIAARKLVASAENPAEMKAQLAEGLRQHIDIRRVAALGLVDDVIDPRDTRRVLGRALARSANKQVERPGRKHGVRPV